MRRSEGVINRERRGGGRRVFGVGGAVALTAALTVACGGGEDTCLSPRAESPNYPGDPAADPNNQATWRTAIEVTTRMPSDAKGLKLGFQNPTSPKPEWKDSEPVAADRADTLFAGIGSGPVRFSTIVVAEEGSAACSQPPDTDFSRPQPIEQLVTKGAVSPEWP